LILPKFSLFSFVLHFYSIEKSGPRRFCADFTWLQQKDRNSRSQAFSRLVLLPVSETAGRHSSALSPASGEPMRTYWGRCRRGAQPSG